MSYEHFPESAATLNIVFCLSSVPFRVHTEHDYAAPDEPPIVPVLIRSARKALEDTVKITGWTLDMIADHLGLIYAIVQKDTISLRPAVEARCMTESALYFSDQVVGVEYQTADSTPVHELHRLHSARYAAQLMVRTMGDARRMKLPAGLLVPIAREAILSSPMHSEGANAARVDSACHAYRTQVERMKQQCADTSPSGSVISAQLNPAFDVREQSALETLLSGLYGSDEDPALVTDAAVLQARKALDSYCEYLDSAPDTILRLQRMLDGARS